MQRLKSKQAFTLVELMVVLVISAMMAATAAPLYTNYVKDARRTEAAGALAAIATAEQEYYSQTGTYAGGLAYLDVDLTDLNQSWTFSDPAVTAGPPFQFTCVATGKAGTSHAGLSVTLTCTLGGAKTLTDEHGMPL
jgi:type IV pilus assembly protein PilE